MTVRQMIDAVDAGETISVRDQYLVSSVTFERGGDHDPIPAGLVSDEVLDALVYKVSIEVCEPVGLPGIVITFE